jgi:hypothetical protein
MKVASVTVSAMAHGLCVGGVHWWLSTGAGKRIPIVSALSSAELVLGGSLQSIKGKVVRKDACGGGSDSEAGQYSRKILVGRIGTPLPRRLRYSASP